MDDFLNPPYNQPRANFGYGAYGVAGGGGYGGNNVPTVDFRRRENQNPGNSSFAPPGGIQTGNPLIDMGVGMFLRQQFPGKEFRPLGGFDGSDRDYIAARQRYDQSFQRYGQIAASSPILGYDDKLSQNPAFQQVADGFKYGGGSMPAFQSAYGRFGHMLARDPATQADRAVQMVQNMDDTFMSGTGKDRKWDYNKSFGFTRTETIENLDSAQRFGLTGLSNAQLSREVAAGRGGAAMAKANEVTRLGKGTFGQDQSADQVNELLDKAMGGIEGVKPEKAADFLARVQTTARALDVNAKAFAEYMAAQQKVYKDMGVGGGTAANAIMRTALDATVNSQRARETGNVTLGDKNQAMAAANANMARAAGSSFNREMTYIASQVSQMTPEARAAAAGGKGADNTLRAIEAKLRAGDVKGAEALERELAADVGGMGQVRRNASRMSEETKRRGEDNFDVTAKRDSNAAAIRRQIEGATVAEARQQGASDQAIAAYQKAAPNLERTEMEDQARVAQELEKQGLGPQEAKKQAAILGRAASGAATNLANVAGYGVNSQAELDDALMNSATGARGRRKEEGRNQKKEGAEVRSLNLTMGDKTRRLNAGDLGKAVQVAITGVMKAVNSGKPADWDELGKALINELGEAAGTAKLEEVKTEVAASQKAATERGDDPKVKPDAPGKNVDPEFSGTPDGARKNTGDFQIPGKMSREETEKAKAEDIKNSTANPTVKVRDGETMEDAAKRMGRADVSYDKLPDRDQKRAEASFKMTENVPAGPPPTTLFQKMIDHLGVIAVNTTPENGGPVARTPDRD